MRNVRKNMKCKENCGKSVNMTPTNFTEKGWNGVFATRSLKWIRWDARNWWWDNLTPRTIWHRSCKEDNLTPRTIWHHHKFYISTIVWPRNMIRNILIAPIYLFEWKLSCIMSLYENHIWSLGNCLAQKYH